MPNPRPKNETTATKGPGQSKRKMMIDSSEEVVEQSCRKVISESHRGFLAAGGLLSCRLVEATAPVNIPQTKAAPG
jgi:hypothetical protein